MKGLVVENKGICLREDLDQPTAKRNELLVKVVCASLNKLDIENIEGKYDLLLKLSGGNYPVKTGIEFSGIVLESGQNFTKGDKVFGYVNLIKGVKTHQEVISVCEDYMACMPVGLSFEQAAALPLGALTSLEALENLAGVTKGSKVLINGAAGGLGVYAIQLAKLFGASVTAVAGSEQDEFLRRLGADDIVDYNQLPIEALDQQFDLLFDLSNLKRFKAIQHLLKPRGVFIPAEPNQHLSNIISSLFTAKKTKYLMVDRGNNAQLTRISNWVAEGKLKVFSDRVYKLEDYSLAMKRLNERGRQGRIIIRVSNEI